MTPAKTIIKRGNIAAAAMLLFSVAILAIIGTSRFSPGAFAAAPASQPASAQYNGGPGGSQVSVSGTSTLHDWTVKTSTINGSAKFSRPVAFDSAGAVEPVDLQSIALVIPVESLKSTEGSGMDDTMYDALNKKQFPNITYELTSASLKSTPTIKDPAYHFSTTGQLTVSGKTKTVNLELVVKPQENGQLTVSTQTALKMTDFGVNPPTAMLGMIKSGDAITVSVTWQLTMQTPAAIPAKASK